MRNKKFKSFSDAAEDIKKRYPNSLKSKRDNDSMMRELQRLADEQEEYKAQQQQAMGSGLSNGGSTGVSSYARGGLVDDYLDLYAAGGNPTNPPIGTPEEDAARIQEPVAGSNDGLFQLTPGEVNAETYPTLAEYNPIYNKDGTKLVEYENDPVLSEYRTKAQQAKQFRKDLSKQFDLPMKDGQFDFDQLGNEFTLSAEQWNQVDPEAREQYYQNLEWNNAFNQRVGYAPVNYTGATEGAEDAVPLREAIPGQRVLSGPTGIPAMERGEIPDDFRVLGAARTEGGAPGQEFYYVNGRMVRADEFEKGTQVPGAVVPEMQPYSKNPTMTFSNYGEGMTESEIMGNTSPANDYIRAANMLPGSSEFQNMVNLYNEYQTNQAATAPTTFAEGGPTGKKNPGGARLTQYKNFNSADRDALNRVQGFIKSGKEPTVENLTELGVDVKRMVSLMKESDVPSELRKQVRDLYYYNQKEFGEYEANRATAEKAGLTPEEIASLQAHNYGQTPNQSYYNDETRTGERQPDVAAQKAEEEAAQARATAAKTGRGSTTSSRTRTPEVPLTMTPRGLDSAILPEEDGYLDAISPMSTPQEALPTVEERDGFGKKLGKGIMDNAENILAVASGLAPTLSNVKARNMLNDPNIITPEAYNPTINSTFYDNRGTEVLIDNQLASSRDALTQRGGDMDSYVAALGKINLSGAQAQAEAQVQGQKMNMAEQQRIDSMMSAANQYNTQNRNQALIDHAQREDNVNAQRRAYTTAIGENVGGIFDDMANLALSKKLAPLMGQKAILQNTK